MFLITCGFLKIIYLGLQLSFAFCHWCIIFLLEVIHQENKSSNSQKQTHPF